MSAYEAHAHGSFLWHCSHAHGSLYEALGVCSYVQDRACVSLSAQGRRRIWLMPRLFVIFRRALCLLACCLLGSARGRS